MPKEIVFPAKNTFELQEYADGPLAAGEIRGATVATLISPGTELAWAQGDEFPMRPGYAAVFRVDEIGADVSGVSKGELRFCMGAHRGTQQYDARDTLPVPDGMAAETALLARLMGVSMTSLMTTRARPGDRVVVVGAGPVGLLAAQNFRIGGYEVTVVEPDELRRAQVAGTGIGSVLSAMPLGDAAFVGKVALVLDCSGHDGAVSEACELARQGGEVVLVGVPWRQRSEASAHELLRKIFFGYVHVRSGWEWEVPIHRRGFVWEELLEGYNNAPQSVFSGFVKALRWLEEGRVQVDGLMRVCAPSDAPVLYPDIAARRIKEPLIVLDWTREK